MAVLVGKQAPDFTASAVMGDNSINSKFNLKEYAKGKICVLFFYPLDFTFVCPSEILAFNAKLKDFDQKNAVVVGVSIDSQYSHLAYKNTSVKNGGIGNIQYPLVADITKNIARDYDVLFNESIAFRGTFIIDENWVVRHQIVNDLPLGRSIEEALRIVDAIEHHSLYGEVCPANWHAGKVAMKPTQEGVADYLANHVDNA